MVLSKAHSLVLIFGLIAALLLPAAPSQAQSPGSSKKRRAPQTPRNAPGKQPFEQMAKQATAAREAGRIDEAVRLYVETLRVYPKWPEGWWYLGAILYDRNQYPQAAEAFRRLATLEPKNGPAWAMLGLCEFQLRDYERALIDIQRGRILGLGNNNELTAVVRYHAAILFVRFEQFEVAYEALRDFVREGNESQRVIETFGLAMLRMPFLSAEIPPDRRDLVLLAGRGGYYMAARRPHEARKLFEEMVARYPQTSGVHYAYGVFLLNENADAALEQFRKELELSPSHAPAMLQIAFEYIKRGDFAAGLPFARKAVELAPALFPARNAYGRILLETGDVAGAVRELEAGVKLAPDSPEMQFALARAYARAGRRDDAAKARAEFQRLDKMLRIQRQGPQSVGGTEAKPDEKPPR